MVQYSVESLQYLRQMGITCWVKREPDITTQLRQLSTEVSLCQQCLLHQTRHQTLFSEGSPHATLMVIGDAPNHFDNKQGILLSGPAREVRDHWLLSLGLTIEQVYWSNLVKCSLPDDRHPTDEILTACDRFIQKQIEIVSPHIILALGEVVGATLLKRACTLESMRMKWHNLGDIPLAVTYAPRDLLLQPDLKRAAYADLLFIQERFPSFYVRT